MVLSGLIFRRGFSEVYINRVNEELANLAEESVNVRFVDPNSWLGEGSLARDGLHLNSGGAKKLGALFSRIVARGSNI